jgi:hypothetical protein
MKHLLIVANLYHSSPRIPEFGETLLNNGWKVTVLTSPLKDNAAINLNFPKNFSKKIILQIAPYRGDIFWIYRKFLSFFGLSNKISYTEQLKDIFGKTLKKLGLIDWLMLIYQAIFAIPDTERTWFKSAISKFKEIKKVNKFDAIISSSPFPTVHRVAKHIKKEINIPWIADFRDLWSQNHNYSFPRIRQMIDRYLEIRTILTCNLITTTSKSWCNKLTSLHKKKVIVIRNGFQCLDFTPIIKLSDRFTITYTGTIYDKKHDPEKIIKSLKNLIDLGSIDVGKISINFYGKYSSLLETIIKKYKVEKVVKQLGLIDRIETRKKQLESHVLLFFQWDDLKEIDLCPLKFYEYLDSGKNILATGGSKFTEVANIIKKTNSGFIAVDVIDIQKILKKLYNQFIKKKKLVYLGNKKIISNYSYAKSSKKFKNILNRLIVNEKSI